MIAIYLDDDVVREYYAVVAVLHGPVTGHPRGWLRENIEELVKRETVLLRGELDEQLGNTNATEHCDAGEGS